jgi:cytochrome c553
VAERAAQESICDRTFHWAVCRIMVNRVLTIHSAETIKSMVRTIQAGAATYLGSRAACHGADGKGEAPFMPALGGNPAVLDLNAYCRAREERVGPRGTA